MNFEQLNENILLNNKVVFTLKDLQWYVNMFIDYPEDLEFHPDTIHSDYYGDKDRFCIDQWLDTEANFQSACKELLEYFTKQRN